MAASARPSSTRAACARCWSGCPCRSCSTRVRASSARPPLRHARRSSHRKPEAVLRRESRMTPELQKKCIDTIRFLAVDAVEKANSGHPGMPMGAAPMAFVLWSRHLRFNPNEPRWANRDRFVLSAGHGSMLLYTMLHLTGFDVTMDDLQHFRQWGSRTPGHPEYGDTVGVEVTTGPLGQGFGNSVGIAMTERWLAATFNRPGHEI